MVKINGGNIIKKDNLLNIEIGSRIQKARKALGITQMEFSENIGVSTQYISDLERGVVGASVTTIIKISEKLHISTDMILKGTDTTNQPTDLLLHLKKYTPEQQQVLLNCLEQLEFVLK